MTNSRLTALRLDPRKLPLGNLVWTLSGMVSITETTKFLRRLPNAGFNGNDEAWLDTLEVLIPKYREELNRREEEYRTYRR